MQKKILLGVLHPEELGADIQFLPAHCYVLMRVYRFYRTVINYTLRSISNKPVGDMVCSLAGEKVSILTPKGTCGIYVDTPYRGT